MTNRTLILLAGTFLILSILALVGQRNQEPTSMVTNLLFSGLLEELNSIELIELAERGNTVVTTLNLSTDGWTVTERSGYPANTQKINRMLLTLAEARILEEKTSRPEWHDRLGVESIEREDAGGLGIRLVGSDLPVNVIVGDSAGDNQVYVRKADQTQSYLIDKDPEAGRSPTDWLDTEILSISTNRIQQVKLQHPDGEILTIFKNDSDQSNFTVSDIPENRELQYESIANTIGSTLSGLSLQDVGLHDSFEEDITIAEFRTFDGLILIVESIRQDDEGWVALNLGHDDSNNFANEEVVSDDSSSAEMEVLELGQKLNGWKYRIPTYQFNQLTRRMDDLLRPLPDDS